MQIGHSLSWIAALDELEKINWAEDFCTIQQLLQKLGES